ncbi:non-hydrolyzing UDP-N-acetylglucosamine 2-epimerase [Salinigranum halophilum]|uniref:non-hydrolyzing UDP-N-acetylglucosamine 2-epimerase n=1 Tax=Salinigranum halophilum TaxID=2565931 RepID=UPI002AA2A049|nr:UDP-N-acetylglucosamine 2-epimerase (non-hydrolyzing) [Salinigranum halophilum]
MMTDIVIVLGTRPEIIKLAPVIRECERRDVEFSVIHTGQHYSDSLDSVFFEKLDLPTPEYNLEVGSKSHGEQTGEMMAGIEEILLDEEPEAVLVQGDTNSVLAGALAADKLDMDVGHIEAGLRSFDREMPEESNRRVTDHVSDYLFAPTETAADFLRQEGIDEDRIFVTGNTVVDAVQEHIDVALRKSSVLSDLDLDSGEYVLMTAHRAENVDDATRFQRLLRGASRVGNEFGIDVVYPIHPRAEAKLDDFNLEVPAGIRLVPPQDYLDFLVLQSEARLILTDSGGIQEEASILGVPCVTMRDNTERPETVEVGANQLSGINSADILSAAQEMDDSRMTWQTPYGDGMASQEILSALRRSLPVREVVQ